MTRCLALLAATTPLFAPSIAQGQAVECRTYTNVINRGWTTSVELTALRPPSLPATVTFIVYPAQPGIVPAQSITRPWLPTSPNKRTMHVTGNDLHLRYTHTILAQRCEASLSDPTMTGYAPGGGSLGPAPGKRGVVAR